MFNNNNLFNIDNDFKNELDNFLNEKIHLHHKQRGRKCQTLIVGLIFNSKDDIKIFLSKVKKKFCVSGSHKKIIELDDKENVFEFAGDIRDNLKDYLIAEYNKNEENIVIHG